ncbi:MAG: META domain-containing protein [Helicobacteraceae bacterium]|jgi:heat shock protein HslJ|nr:META domain-containing protein [Helicobacteraceae bacterium]
MKHFCALAIGALCIFTTLGCAKKIDDSQAASKEWRVVEIRKESGVKIGPESLMDRELKDSFIIAFETNRITGAGVSSRFSATYAIIDDSITIFAIKITGSAAPIKEPIELKEREFFTLLKNVYRWTIASDKLTLFTKDGGGKEAALIFKER